MNPIISILNSVKEIVTFENITFLLGLIGSVGTTWQVIQSRRKIRLSLPYFGYSAEKQLALAYIQFDNLSNSAVSITDGRVSGCYRRIPERSYSVLQVQIRRVCCY